MVVKEVQDDEHKYFGHASVGDASTRFTPNLTKKRVKIITLETVVRRLAVNV
jgi:hypothetical protein